eukprot:tig00000215_g18645.t1
MLALRRQGVIVSHAVWGRAAATALRGAAIDVSATLARPTGAISCGSATITRDCIATAIARSQSQRAARLASAAHPPIQAAAQRPARPCTLPQRRWYTGKRLVQKIKGRSADKAQRRERERERGPDPAVMEKVVRLTTQARELLEDDASPEAEARLKLAVDVATREFGPRHQITLATMSALGDAYMQRRDLDKAQPIFEACLAACVASGKDAPDDETRAATMFLEAADASDLDASDRAELAMSLALIAGTLRRHGFAAKAVPLLERALFIASEGGEDIERDTTIPELCQALAEAHSDLGNHDKTVPLLQRALADLRAQKTPDSEEVVEATRALATALAARGDPKAAVAALETALAARGDPKAAVAALEGSLESLLGALGDGAGESAAVGLLLGQLGALHADAASPAHDDRRAVACLEAAERALCASVGDGHPQSLPFVFCLGRVYHCLGRLDDARAAFERLLPALENAGVASNPEFGGPEAFRALAAVHVQRGDLASARAVAKRAAALGIDVRGADGAGAGAGSGGAAASKPKR